MHLKTLLLSSFCSVLLLSACSNGAKEKLGLLKTTPDEFSVITRAPLSVPPEYTLRPPRPGVGRPMEQNTVDQARQTVFGADDLRRKSTAQASPEFMDKIGVYQADEDIRERLETENLAPADNRPVAERLLFWQAEDDEGDVIDPRQEQERLQQY